VLRDLITDDVLSQLDAIGVTTLSDLLQLLQGAEEHRRSFSDTRLPQFASDFSFLINNPAF